MTEKLPSELDFSTAAEQSSEEDEAQEGNVLDAQLHSVDPAEHNAMHVVEESDEPDLDGLLDALEAAVDPEADSVVDDALDIDSAEEADAAVEATHDEADDDAPHDEAAAGDEADEADVDPYEEFKLELRMKSGKWYVVHSYAGFEKRVKQNIENRKISMNMEESIYEVQVPMEDVVEIKNGQRKLVTRVRIPSYVLVRMDLNEDSWSVVRHTPGVTGFVGNAHNPTPLRFDEAFQMLKSTVQIAEAPVKAGG
ncbi:MAG: transcription termination/antitermination NusG family protein, partial [Microcella sp.]|nr:transcription termination/antitermination NusG family protein [Microcella sp.]